MSTHTPDTPTVVPPGTGTEAATPSYAPPTTDPAPLFRAAGDRYEIGPEIARGGMGAVHRGRDAAFGREVAVKLLLAGQPADSPAAARFFDEARIGGQLQHPGIPPIYDVGTLPDGRPFLAMKLIKGKTLDTALRDGDALNVPAVFEGICQAVGYAHARRVIHRDLKPQNVMVGAFAEVQVMDWGLAKVLGLCREAEPSDAAGTEIVSARADGTQAGAVMGSPQYLPPEQARGLTAEVDERSDVFGLGGILCALLTGRPVYDGEGRLDTVLMAERADTAAAFERLDGSGADLGLVALCKRCLSAKKGDRPANGNTVAAEVAALRAAADERAKQAELDRQTAVVRAAEARKRHRAQAALAGVLLLLIAGSAAAGLWLYREQELVGIERAGRRDRTAAGVESALASARGLAADAWGLTGHPGRMWARAELAAAAIRQADELIRAGEPAPELTARRDAIAADVAEMVRHARLLSRAELALQEYARRSAGYFDNPRLGAALAAAFREFGLDPTALPPEEFGRAVAASRIRDQLIGLTYEWYARPESPAQGERVYRGHRQAVLAAGGLPAEWQRRVDADDTPGLAALAGSAAAAELAPDLVRLVGRELRRRKQMRANAALLRRAAERYPADVWTQFDAALAAQDDDPGQPVEAVRFAAAAVALRPDASFLRLTLGNAYRAARQYDLAVREYARGFALDPTDQSLVAAVAELLPLATRTDAGAVVRELAAADRTGQALPIARAVEAAGRGDYARAAELYRGVTAGPQAHGEIYARLGAALLAAGDPRGAAEAYDKASERIWYVVAYPLKAGAARAAAGDWAGAAAALRRAIQVDPRNPGAHAALGAVLAESDDLDGAIRNYRSALRLDPTRASVRINLGGALERRGEFAAAVTQYREAAGLQPGDGSVEQRLSRAERLQRLAARLPGVLDGTDRPADPAEAAALADICVRPAFQRYAAAVRLFTPAPGPHRYNAACAAALAAAGLGVDPPTSPRDRAALRGRALGWMRDELAEWQRSAASPDPHLRAAAAAEMSHCLRDADFASVRPGIRRIGLPAAEREQWDAFWADLRAVLAAARTPPPPREPAPPPRRMPR